MGTILTDHYGSFLQSYTSPALQFCQQYAEYIKNSCTPASYVKILKYASAYFFLYIGARRIYDAYYGTLRNIPGPFICKFINVPVFIFGLPIGTLYKSIDSFHKVYGNIVRIGPKKISVADKNMLEEIYITKELEKGPIYDFFSSQTSESLFTTTDKFFHKKLRERVSVAFTDKSIRSQETFMQLIMHASLLQIDKSILLTKQINDTDTTGFGTIDIWKTLQNHAYDVIGESVFGETFHAVEVYQHPIVKSVSKSIELSGIAMMFPKLVFIVSSILPKKKQDPQLTKTLLDTITKRRNGTKPRRDDILQALIDTQESDNVEERLSTEDIVSEALVYLVAGAETAGKAMGFVIIELLNNLEKMKKLVAEIDAVPIVEGEMGNSLQHDDLKDLPYLNAVINEAMRLNAIAAVELPRRTTKKTILGSYVVLPEDIIVECSTFSVHMNEEYWKDSASFIPERWIKGEIEHEESKDTTGSFIPFSLGSRNCIGKSFALQEIRITVATLLKFFEFVSIPEEMLKSKDRRTHVGITLAHPSFKVNMKRRE